MKTLQVLKLSDKATLPTRNLPYDAGIDLYASEDVFIPVGATVKIPTDIAVNIEPFYVGLVCDRSSMASKGLKTGAGVIDPGYTGHLCVVLHNLNNQQDCEIQEVSYNPQDIEPTVGAIISGYKVHAGDKIAQLIIQPIELVYIKEISELPSSERNTKGFGSSGV